MRPSNMFQVLVAAAISFAALLTSLASPHISGRTFPAPRQNTSALPSGWTSLNEGFCWEDFGDSGELAHFLLGPSLVDPTGMTIESCVNFCDQQKNRIAGVENRDTCYCGNTFNPHTGFESVDGSECDMDCTGNPHESCGGPSRIALWMKDDGLCTFRESNFLLTSGPWRFAYYYNDTVGARALRHNAVDLHPSLKRGNLTVESCVNACGTAGFLLAGMEYADECYCGNELENFSRRVPGCNAGANAMPCKGNNGEFCGGPNLLFVFTLPGSNVEPLIPFDSKYDGF